MSNNRDKWETPDTIVELLNEEFHFDLDVAANSQNRKCPDYLGPDHADPLRRDALAFTWAPHTCWLNPPYSNIKPWLEKAEEEALKGATVVALIHMDPSTRWFADCATRASEIRILTGARVQFIPPPGVKRSSNTHASAVLVYRPRPWRSSGVPVIKLWRWKEEEALLRRTP